MCIEQKHNGAVTYQKALSGVTHSWVERRGGRHQAPPAHCPLSACGGDTWPVQECVHLVVRPPRLQESGP